MRAQHSVRRPMYTGWPDHDAGGFAAIDAVLSHRRKPEAIRAHASQWGKHLDVEDFLRARARGSGGSWRRNGPLKTETQVRIPLGPPFEFFRPLVNLNFDLAVSG